jgi:FtsP/CotA-like multicopper oxidase with cupredoxin domain
MPRQTMDLAFVADNPGDWLFHCHALEHHAAGLGALIKVT